MHSFNAMASTDVMDQNFDEQKSLIMVDSPEKNLSVSFFLPKAIISEFNKKNVRYLKNISKKKTKTKTPSFF